MTSILLKRWTATLADLLMNSGQPKPTHNKQSNAAIPPSQPRTERVMQQYHKITAVLLRLQT